MVSLTNEKNSMKMLILVPVFMLSMVTVHADPYRTQFMTPSPALAPMPVIKVPKNTSTNGYTKTVITPKPKSKHNQCWLTPLSLKN